MESFKKVFVKILRILKMTEKLKLETGVYVKATIDGQELVGQIVKSRSSDSIYLAQNLMHGSSFHPESCENPTLARTIRHRYAHSWVFERRALTGFTQDVEILEIIPEEEVQKLEEELRNKFTASIRMSGNEISINLLEGNQHLFSYKTHPDCCGSGNLYRFSESTDLSYSPYRFIKDEHIKLVKDYIWKFERGLDVHLAAFQKPAIEFVKKLGFEKLHEYRNVKSGNQILVFHLDPLYKDEEESEVDELPDFD